MADEFIYDDREPKNIQNAAEECGFVKGHLEHGDFIVGPWVVERKQAADFMASVLDGRLLTQALEVRESGREPIVIIEGALDWKYTSNTSLNRHQSYGLFMSGLADIVGVARIPVVPTRDSQGTITFLNSLKSRVLDPIHEVEPPIVKLKRVKPFVAALAQVPGVGLATAKKVAKKWSSFAQMANLRYLDFVDELGPKGGDEMYTFITGNATPEVFKRLGLGKRARSLAAAYPALEGGVPITQEQASQMLDKRSIEKLGDLVR